MTTHGDMAKAGRVSFWLTKNIVDGRELDDYMSLSKRFAADFGFDINPPAGPEMSDLAWSDDAKLLPIEAVLRGFSFERAWMPAAVELAVALGWREARAAIVFYAFE